MTDEHQREAISWLLGKELADEEWEGFAYWYYGGPDFSDVPAWYDEYEYRTAFVDELLGHVPTPEGWERVESYAHSGEGSCPYQGCDLGEDVAACPLCEWEVSKGYHPYEGWLFIGDGWNEVVYRRPRED